MELWEINPNNFATVSTNYIRMKVINSFLILSLLLPLLLAVQSHASILKETIKTTEQQIDEAIQNPTNAALILQNLSQNLNEINPNEFDIDDYLRNSYEALRTLFKVKTKLREFYSLTENTLSTSKRLDLEKNLRKTLNSIRYMEDYIAEAVLTSPNIKPSELLPFKGNWVFNQSLKESHFDINSLESGDIVLVRGNSEISASIARISKSPSTNSHLAIVYKNPVTGESYLLEALQDKSGVVMTDLNIALSEPLARVAVYRSPDKELNTRAAQFAYDQFKEHEKRGEIIKFDLTLDMTYNCRFFCSKFVTWAYDNASEGQVILPQYQSRLLRPNNSFKKRIGVKEETKYSFLPSDIDLDSRFKLIYEYRNPKMTPSVRLDDFITDKIFEWMDKEKLDFHPNFFIKGLSYSVLQAAKHKFTNSILKKININLNSEANLDLVSTMAIMKFTITKIKKELQPQLQAYYAQYGKNMPPSQVYSLIESYKNKNPKILKHFKRKTFSPLNSCLANYN